MSSMMPAPTALKKATRRSIGSVKMRLARSQTSPGWNDVGQAERIEEVHQRIADRRADHAEAGDLLVDPGADLLEDAVGFERLDDQAAERDQLDRAAQDVGAAAVDMAPC